jgi:hypothetical protein
MAAHIDDIDVTHSPSAAGASKGSRGCWPISRSITNKRLFGVPIFDGFASSG